MDVSPQLLWRLVLPALSLLPLVHASSSAYATNPLWTTKTVTSTASWILTVGTTSSTTTPVLCSDGSCIAISIVDVPILSTSISVGQITTTSLIGYTTLYSTVPDETSTAPPTASATPTSANAGSDTATTRSAPTASEAFFTSTPTSSSPTVVTSHIPSSAVSEAFSLGASHTPDDVDEDSYGKGLATRYVIVTAVLAAVVALALVALVSFLILRRHRRRRAARGDVVVRGRHELDGEGEAKVVEAPSAVEEGYRGTAGPPWRQEAVPSELPTYGHAHEIAGSERYEMKA